MIRIHHQASGTIQTTRKRPTKTKAEYAEDEDQYYQNDDEVSEDESGNSKDEDYQIDDNSDSGYKAIIPRHRTLQDSSLVTRSLHVKRGQTRG